MDAIILCGGLGTRIRTVTGDSYPKTMVKIQGKSILEWELEWMKRAGVNHAILAVRHLADYIEEQLGHEYTTDSGIIELSYSKEKEKLGSGGAIRLAEQYVSTRDTLIMNGDVLTDFVLGDLIAEYQKSTRDGYIAVAKMRSPYGVVIIEKNDAIQKFEEKPLLDHWIHAGVDIFKTDVLKRFPEKGQMEETIFIELAEEKKLGAYRIKPTFYWRSIDTAKDFQEAEKDWSCLK